MSTSFFTKGTNSTLVLNRGTNLAYHSTGVAIYTSTAIDRWPVGDFVSVEYIINVEFGKNERETIHATLVAMPGQTAITIYGRTNLTRPLINIRSDATNSYAQLIVEPASLEVQGSIVSFFGNYARSTIALVPLNAPATANSTSWSAVTNVTALTITVPLDKLTGTILIGQLVSNSNLPSISTVTSWNSSTGILVIGWVTAASVSAATLQQLVFTTMPSEPANTISIIQSTQNFKSIEAPGQLTVKATLPGDTIRLIGNNGILITTDAINKQVTFANQAFNSVAVTGQTALNTSVSNSSVLNLVGGTGITLTTNPATNQLTVTGRAPTLTTDDELSLTGFNLRIAGGTGIVTSVANGRITISTNSTVNAYSGFTDSFGASTAANTATSSFKFRSGTGVSVVVEDNHATYGDNLLITNTGVTSFAGLSGSISTDALLTAINSATGSINLPIGIATPSAGAFTTLSASGTGSFGGNVNMNNFKITSLATPSADSDAATKAYVDASGGGAWTTIATAITATAGTKYFANTATAPFTIALPASPATNAIVYIADLAGTFDRNNLTVARNSSLIMGLAEDLILNIKNVSVALVYSGATYGWKLV
jgi:hypothetical protein